jgi:type VI secretion system secreted protein VgrG
VPDIVRDVLRTAGVYQGDGELVIDASLDEMAPREYCVQHQESDLDFVRRLLEEEGIPFYFRHEPRGTETLVLVGDMHVFAPVPTLDGASLRVLEAGVSTHHTESLRYFDERHTLQPTSVAVRDFDFTRPQTQLSPTSTSTRGPRALFDFPARASLTNYDEGSRTYQTENTARLARVRHEAFLTRAHVGGGRGNVTGFVPGLRFDLEGHEQAETNRAYLVVSVEHAGMAWSELPDDVSASERLVDSLADAGVEIATRRGRTRTERYTNRFHTHRVDGEATVPFRPLRTIPRPVVEGPQTAWVVGPPGEEIHTDPHGRIKVQFHWDRRGRSDDHSSCWIRVAQGSSGSGWGLTILPRIGMEVVVSFLEGDPDRPLITGCVNNGENGTSYPLPDMKTRTVLKTWSSPQSGGYNEIRFEDKTGAEQLYIQAERDHDTLVKHDQTVTVRRHRTKRVQGDEHNTILQNRVTRVVQDNLRTVDGNQDVEIHGAQGATLSIDNHYTVWVGGNRSLKVDGTDQTTVGRSRSANIGSNDAITVGNSHSVSVVKAGVPLGSHAMTPGKSEMTTGLGATITLEGAKITLTADTIFFNAKNIYGAASEKIAFGGTQGVSMGSASGEASVNGKTLKLTGTASADLTSSGATTVSGTPVQLNGPGLFAGRVTELAPATITTGAALVLVGGASFPFPVERLPDGTLKVGDHIYVKPGTNDPNFQNKVMRDLGIMSSTPSGLERLNNLQNNPGGHDITIREMTPAEIAQYGKNNSLAYRLGDGGLLTRDGSGNLVPGSGSGTDIAYNPDIVLGPPGTPEPADAVLFHEMGHAEHNAYGVNRVGDTLGHGWDNHEEFQTIEDGINRPGGTNNIPGVPRSPTENEYLGDRNYPYRRTDHGGGYSNPDGTPIRP